MMNTIYWHDEMRIDRNFSIKFSIMTHVLWINGLLTVTYYINRVHDDTAAAGISTAVAIK